MNPIRRRMIVGAAASIAAASLAPEASARHTDQHRRWSEALPGRIASLEDRVAALEGVSGVVPAATPEQRVADLERRVADLEEKAP